MGKMIVCKYCGKEYDDDLEKCPSCESLNLKGAEKAYMGKLQNVREDMSELDAIPGQELKTTIKKQGKLLKKVLIIALAVIVVFAGLAFWMHKRNEQDYRAEYLWMRQNYPRLDEVYESGDYKALAKLYLEISEDEHSVFYEWEHYEFLESYLECLFMEQDMKAADGLEPRDSTFTFLFYEEWKVKGIEYRKEEFSEEEYAAMQPYIEMAQTDFDARWNLSAEDYDELFQIFAERGYRYVDFERCEDFIKKWVKENR